MTHYIPAFAPTTTDRRRQQAVCGSYVDPRTHADPPTCPICQTLIAKDDADAKREAADKGSNP